MSAPRSNPTLITASGMNAFTACQRRFYLAYELGLRETAKADALRFGTAFHAALEARANGEALHASFARGLDTAGECELDKLTAVTLCALVSGYYAAWGDASEGRDGIAEMRPEQVFAHPFCGSDGRTVRGFRAAGVIDGLAIMTDGRRALVEHKTTSEDISPASSYWDRLSNNRQIYTYVDAARRAGWDLDTVIYDVVRKPTIRQKQDETVEDFGVRLAEDCSKTRPDYYYARREVPITEAGLREFRIARGSIVDQIRALRRAGARAEERGCWSGDPWVQCHSQMVCRGCPYRGLCSAGTKPTLADVPAGFEAGHAHDELAK